MCLRLTGDSDPSEEELIHCSGIIEDMCQVTVSVQQNRSACQLSALIKESL